ncbi:MAG: ABC transporter substrate-binding protein [Pseudonocardiaceae bacterium]
MVRRTSQQQLAPGRVEVGSLLDREQKAPTGPLELIGRGRARQRIHEAEKSVQSAAPRTAAAVFVTLGGGPLYTYDPQSMVDAQMEATGLTNAFGDAIDQRDIETSLETILGKEPDVLILLTVADLAATKDSFLAIPGATNLKAVRNDNIMVIRFDYVDPPTPLSVDGLDTLARAFGRS